jgi:molybdenum cofactor cytidylyltransferase
VGAALAKHGVMAAVLLAAGEARRLGGICKPLLELDGVPLVRRTLLALREGGVDEVVVVLGHCADEVERAVRDLPITLVRNPDYGRGQIGSLRVGLAALSPAIDAFMVALADQPLIDAQDISALIGAFRARGEGAVLLPCVNGERANPVVFEAAVRDEVLEGDSDFGCRQWMDRHPARIVRFDTDNEHYRADIDTPEDLVGFERRYGHTLHVAASDHAKN